jgi:hypothetical protein
MKKAHNVYIENAAWEAARKVSVKYKDLLPVELSRKPSGTSSAYVSLVSKMCLLFDDPGLIHDTRVDWKPAIEYCKRLNLSLSKYITQLP